MTETAARATLTLALVLGLGTNAVVATPAPRPRPPHDVALAPADRSDAEPTSPRVRKPEPARKLLALVLLMAARSHPAATPR